MCGAGAGGDDDGVATRRDVGPQHREDLRDVRLLSARRRRRPDVELQRRLVGQLAQSPPRVPALARSSPRVVEVDEARRAKGFDVDRHVTADRGRRP